MTFLKFEIRNRTFYSPFFEFTYPSAFFRLFGKGAFTSNPITVEFLIFHSTVSKKGEGICEHNYDIRR